VGGPEFPMPIGSRGAGVVEALSPNVSGFRAGDRKAIFRQFDAQLFGWGIPIENFLDVRRDCVRFIHPLHLV
jgi:NADPH:quinone reductase-like Zn-dependent oxidoreductase